MKFGLHQISEYRSSIMGVGIIWVVLYHFQVKGLLAPILTKGFMGVDLFMFVSGFGLFYSLKKNNDLLQFYKKRFVRIFPLYFSLGLLYELLHGNFNILTVIWKYSTLSYWTSGVYGFGWFIPAIMAIYLFYPYLHRTLFYKEYEKIVPPTLFTVFFFFIVWCIINNSALDRNHFLLLYRLPVFLLGVLTASENDNLRGGCNKNTFIILSVVLLPIFLIRYISPSNIYLSDFSTIFIIPLIIVVLCLIFKYIKPLRVFEKVGDASLEIFCLHYIVHDVVCYWSIDTRYHTMVMYCACLITVVLGILIHAGWKKVLNLFY